MSAPDTPSRATIGLALSGGGVRAAAFHAGVLRYLAEQGRLEDVAHISSVSGGSLFAGMTFTLGGNSWPSSEKYLSEVYPRFRTLLTTQSLQWSAILRLLFCPSNWRYALSRANVLAQSIQHSWGVTATLQDVSATPVWSINCTTAETGRRFRFKNKTMGDYELGYTDASDMKLAQAMAVSAAFPGGIGPLSIKCERYSWSKREQWGADKAAPCTLPYPRLHLYDGGLYDNLGMEPLFDVGKQIAKKDEVLGSSVDFVLVSDGGAPLARQPIPHQLNPMRFKRIADIALDQCRALRVRMFAGYLERSGRPGTFLWIGSDAKKSLSETTSIDGFTVAALLEHNWISASDAKQAANYPTNLKRMPEESFDLIALHGYESAKWNLELIRAGHVAHQKADG